MRPAGAGHVEQEMRSGTTFTTSAPATRVALMVERVVEGQVGADYSQFELWTGEGGHVATDIDVGLASSQISGPDGVSLTTARQWGEITVRASFHEEEPLLDPTWDAVVDLSAHLGTGAAATGWGGEGELRLPAPHAIDVRVRYVVVTGQDGSDLWRAGDEHVTEHYLLQLWPAPPRPARVVVSSSPWSQYWTFGTEAVAVAHEVAALPAPDGLVAAVDRSFAAHPEVAERLRAGDARYRSGVLRYAQELLRVTHGSPGYSDVRDDHTLLERLVDERARLAGR